MRIHPRSLNHFMRALSVCGLVSSCWATDGTSSPLSSSATSPSPATSSATASAPLFDFDLPAQPLIEALQRYGTLTRQPALFRSEIVNGRTSAAVSGRYSTEAALRLLLAGTGLVAEKFDHGAGGAFILKASTDAPTDASRVANLGRLSGYPGRVQTRVWRALCDNPRTVPGEYRSLLRFQVDAAGQIQRPRLIGSTGDAGRDAAVLDVLRHVRMDSTPPSDLEQPVTMLLLPYDVHFDMRCDQVGGLS
ncbi:secretin and TonB N-terminal domain-containing protein [Variovorax sp. LT1R16]|uniref:secretin and TonB N-terminal domain-containing protein n=1 Tax=Variovorax sp. LT1R16 TaxID=3443728 RepID=UPI003F46531B